MQNIFGHGKKHKIITYLDELVPARGHNHRVLGVRAEAHARHPVGVALVSDGVLAVTKGVPELDAAITRGGDNLAVVGGERDGEDVIVVADEGAGGSTAGELPEAEGLVPRGGEGVGTVRGDHLHTNTYISASIVPFLRFLVGLDSDSSEGEGLRKKHTQSETM